MKTIIILNISKKTLQKALLNPQGFLILLKIITLKFLKKIFDFLLYGNFFIALCAAAQAVQTLYIRHLSVDGNPHIVFIFTATFFLYNIHKPITFYLKKNILEHNPAVERTEARFIHAKEFEAPLSILTFTAGLVCLETFFRFYISVQWLLFFVGLLSLAYVLPIFNGKRLRDVPYIKIFIIAGVWAFVTVTFPIKAFGQEWYSCDTFMVVERMAFVLAITIPFDIRDMAFDAKTGVKTIPLSMGIQKSKWLSLFFLTLSFSIACMIFMMGVYLLNTLIAIGISILISAYIIYKINDKRSDYYYYFLVDGLLLLQSILVMSL